MAIPKVPFTDDQIDAILYAQYSFKDKYIHEYLNDIISNEDEVITYELNKTITDEEFAYATRNGLEKIKEQLILDFAKEFFEVIAKHINIEVIEDRFYLQKGIKAKLMLIDANKHLIRLEKKKRRGY